MTIKKFEVPDYIRSVLICDPTDIWGNVVGIGLSELSAILTPCHRFDRRGSVFFWDTFDDGMGAWGTNLYGAGAAAELSTATSLHGPLSVELIGGSDGERLAKLNHGGLYPVEGKVGAEFSFSFDTDIDNIEFILRFLDGAYYIRGSVRYNHAEAKLQYNDSADAWQDIATSLTLVAVTTDFHTVKLVVDMVTRKYVRAMLDNTEYPLTDIALYTEISTDTPAMTTEVRLYSRAGYNDVAYIDSCVLTQNEPA